MGKSAGKVILGGAITALSFANKFFGLFRSIDYIHKNAPAVYDVVTSATFEISLMIVGLTLTAVGIFEILGGKKAGAVGIPAPAGPRSVASGRDQSNVASVGSIGNVAPGATVIVGGAHGRPSTGRPIPQQPNITYCGFRRTSIFLGSWASTGARAPRNSDEFEKSILGILVKFENDVWTDGNGHRAMDVLAKVIYRFANAPEVRIDYAAWLGASIRFESLDIGDTRELLILLHTEGHDLPEFNVLNDNRDLNANFSEPFSWFRPEPIERPDSIQVTVIEQQSRAKIVFEFEVTGSGADIGVTLKNSGN